MLAISHLSEQQQSRVWVFTCFPTVRQKIKNSSTSAPSRTPLPPRFLPRHPALPYPTPRHAMLLL